MAVRLGDSVGNDSAMATPLLEVTQEVLRPRAKLHLVTLVQVGEHEDGLPLLERARADFKATASELPREGSDVSSRSGPVAVGAGADINHYAVAEWLVRVAMGQRMHTSQQG